MKNSKKILSVVIGLALISSAALFAKDEPVKEVPGKVVSEKAVANINGVVITQGTLDSYLAVIGRSRPDSISASDALDDLIITELAFQQAKKDGVADRDDVKKQINEAIKKVILTTWTREKSENMKVSDKDLKAAYDENMKEQATSEFKARHILVKTEDEAKAILKELEGGADFEKLAKEKSTGPSGPNGGDLGWFKPGTMVPPFAKAVEAMEKGSVSKAAVKTNFGWHIIKLEDKRDAKLPSFESMKPQIKPLLAQKKMIEYIESLRGSADIKITLPEEKAADEKEAKKKVEEKK